MKDLIIQEGIAIPLHEIEISASRAGGPGGQHVNKTNTRITVRWNLHASQSLTPQQKERIAKRLEAQLTQEGDLVIHNGSTRSQEQNKRKALEQLANRIAYGLFVPKKRMKTKITKHAKEKRLMTKKKHGMLKKTRSKKIDY